MSKQAPQEPRTGGVRAWKCPNCSALISESVIGDPPEAQTLVRCAECDRMVELSEPHACLPLAEAEALRTIAEYLGAAYGRGLPAGVLRALDTLGYAPTLKGSAEALIDPNDPKTRATIRERASDRVDAALFDWMGLTPSDEMVSETIDAVLDVIAALRSKP